eukprot:15465585-Alexandrium_andersonii.AAC.1
MGPPEATRHGTHNPIPRPVSCRAFPPEAIRVLSRLPSGHSIPSRLKRVLGREIVPSIWPAIAESGI